MTYIFTLIRVGDVKVKCFLHFAPPAERGLNTTQNFAMTTTNGHNDKATEIKKNDDVMLQ